MFNCPAKPVPTETIQLTGTLVLDGVYFDGNNRRYNLTADNGTEGQPPVILIRRNSIVRNLIIGNLSAGGIHCDDGCFLENVWFEDVGEAAVTAFNGNNNSAILQCGGAFNSGNIMFRHNHRASFHIRGFQASGANTLYRSCHNCTANGSRLMSIADLRADGFQTIAEINRNYFDIASIDNLIVSSVGNPAPITVCEDWQGVSGQGTPQRHGVQWAGGCSVSPSDVTVVNNTQIDMTGYTGSEQPQRITE
jgi:hypothetical protein